MKDQLTGSAPSNLGYGNRPVDLKPEEDFSAEAAAKREQARQIDFTDSKRQTNLKIERLNAEPVGYMGYGGVSHRNIALAYFHDQARSLVDRENRRRDIPDFVNLPGVKTLVEQAKAGGVDLTTEQISQLADFGVLNAAADRIIAAAKANNGAGDPIGMMNVYTTLDSNNPVMAQILPSVVEAKLKEIAEDPTWVSQQLEKIGGVVNWVLTPLIAANNWTMEGVRAGGLSVTNDINDGSMVFGPVSWAQGFVSSEDRAQVQAGMLNENYIQQLATAKNPDGTPKYTPKQIDIARNVFVASTSGNPDAVLSVWREKYAGDEEAAPIFRDIMYSRSTGTTQELLRQIDSAHLGNTGQVTFGAPDTTAEYDPSRGGELRQDLANIAGVGVSIALDPTLLLGRAGKAMKAVLWGIERLAPGVPAAEVLSKARFGRLSVTTPAYRYFNTLAKYLNDLESLDQTAVRAGRAATEASDDATRNAALARKLRAEQDAASLRQRMSRQFDELPDDLIDEFRASPWRNADGKFDVEHIAAHIDDVNDAYVTSMGDVSEKIAAAGATRAELFQAALDINADNFASPAAKAVIKGDLADAIRAENMLKLEAQKLRSVDQRIAARTQGRTALVPRLSVVGRARIAAVNQFAMLLMPQDKAFRLVDEYLRSSGDPATFGEALVANDIAFGIANRRFKFSADGFGDSVGRLFSSIASSRRFNIATGEDSLQVYRYSRSFFPKRTSELIADMYRRADPGARREIVIGLVRSAMASRGLTMTYKDAEEVLFGLKSSADQVMTGSRVGEQYAVSVPVEMLPSERAGLAASGVTDTTVQGQLDDLVLGRLGNKAASYGELAFVRSIQNPVERDAAGDVVLNPSSTYTLGQETNARSSVHFSVNAEVESHLMGQWSKDNQLLVVSGQNMVDANGNPSALRSADTWWQASPGEGVRLPKPTLVTPIADADEYANELVSRGLIQKGDPVPPFASDNANLEVLYLAQGNAEAKAVARRDAIRAAMQQQGVNSNLERLGEYGYAQGTTDLESRIVNLAQARGITSELHSATGPGRLEASVYSLDPTNPVNRFADLGDLPSARWLVAGGYIKTRVFRGQPATFSDSVTLFDDGADATKVIDHGTFSERQVELTDGDFVPAFKLKNGETEYVFRGFQQNNIELADNAEIKILSATPQGLVEEALEIRPRDPALQSLLRNLETGEFGPKENDLFDQIAAALAIDDAGTAAAIEQTDGLALVLSSLAGNKSATARLSDKVNAFKAGVEQTKRTEMASLRSKAAIEAGLAAAADVTQSGVWRSLSADADGMEHAIHLSQTADSVVVPSIRDMERMRNGVRVAFGNGAERVTNMWSLGTLFGLRFSIRNAIEEIGLYWLLGGRAIDLYRGRKLDQAIRKVRPMLSVVDGPSGPETATKSSLGMIASKAEWFSRWVEAKGVPHWMAEMIYRPLDEEAIKAAGVALAQGDTEAFARLAIKSLATQRVFGLRTNLTSEQDRIAFSYLVDSTHGMALLDEIGEAGTYLQSGGYPAYVDNLYGIGEAEPGVEFGKLPQVKFGAYTNIPAKGRDNGVDIYGLGFWWRELQTTLDGDGPIGAAAVAGLQNPAAAKAEIARIIREDTKFGYKEKFSRIRGQWVTQDGKRVYVDDGSIDSFANSYFENVFQHFTRADGSLNTDLQAKFLVTDPETGKVTASWWKLLEPKDIEDLSPAEKQLAKQWVSPRVSRASLAELDVADRPDYIFGREVIKYVPNAANETALLGDRAFAWMGRQNARISRDPLFLANYLDQYRKTLGQRESFAMALAKKREERRDPDVVVSEETLAKEREADMLLAEKVYANQAMDSAFSLTLAYLDNPANRSNLAWKVRNVSRYYRATEDFYRRMKRVVQHDPLALWKGALTYHLLQENGFTYTNDKGEEYFAYPLNNLATGAVIKALGLFNLDVRQYADLNPFSLNGRVTGLTPSLDPNQGVMTLSGPLAAPVAGILSAFPTLAGLRAVLLGKYNRATGNAFADMVQTFIPAGVSKVISASDAERIDTQISSAAFDTVALMTAEGMLDVLTINGKPLDIEPSRVDFTQFSKTDQYQAAQKISASYFFTRLLFSYLAPANPLQQGDTASEFAKQNGIDTIDDAYYDLLDMYKDDPNGLQLALADFYAAKIPSMNGNYDGWDSLLPFTTSSTKFDELSHPAAAMASVRATDDVAKWLKSDETQDLFTRFGDVAWFVAPHTGAFDSTTHTLLTTTLGLKVPKAEAERYMELFALQGRAVEMKIRRDFSEEIAATTDPDELAALNEEKKMMIEANRQINPQWGIQVTTVDPSRNPLLTADLLSKTVSMLAYLREKNGSLTADQQMIANAILTYTEYKSDVEGLKGTVQQKQATKKWLAQNYETDLDVIRNESENAALFIDGVLSTDPNYLYGME